MGIKNLHKFLRKHSDSAYVEVPLSEFSSKTIAIDINIYLYRFKSIHRDKWISVFITLIFILLKYNILCVFVYDTKAPMEKNAKKEERKKKKKTAEQKILDITQDMTEFKQTGVITPLLQSISDKYSDRIKKLLHNHQHKSSLNVDVIYKEITLLNNQIVNISRYDVDTSKKILDILGIPYLDSENEAETLCSHLCYHKQVDAVLSDDTDVLVYGTPIFLTKLNLKQETCTRLNYTDILTNLEMEPHQFTDFCIMCGTDYNDNIQNIGSEKAYKMIMKSNSLETIESEREDTEVLNFRRVREIFNVPDTLQNYNLHQKYCNIERFKEFCSENRVPIQNERIQLLERINNSIHTPYIKSL